MFLQRVAKVLLEKSAPLPELVEVQPMNREDVFAAAGDVMMMLTRTKGRVSTELDPSFPVIWHKKDFEAFVMSIAFECVQRRWQHYQFYLRTRFIEDIEHWETMNGLRRGLAMHNAYPLLTNTRDVYVGESDKGVLDDLLLCTLHIVLQGG